MRLTDTSLKALKPRAKPYTVSDGRGLYIEVFPTGGMVWRYRYRLSGKQKKLTLGKYPALSLKAARARRDEVAVQLGQGRSPARQKAKSTTVAEFPRSS